MIKLCFSY